MEQCLQEYLQLLTGGREKENQEWTKGRRGERERLLTKKPLISEGHWSSSALIDGYNLTTSLIFSYSKSNVSVLLHIGQISIEYSSISASSISLTLTS